MLSIAVLTNRACIAWSVSFLGVAGLVMPGEDCLLHFPWWMIHLGNVMTNVLCIKAMYQILH